MKARILSALCVVTAVAAAGGAAFLTGCASGHKQFAYVVGQGTNEVFEFRALRSGALSPLATPNFAVGSNPSALAVHTSGDFLYVADFSGNDVTLLDINQSTGDLSVPVSSSIVVPVNPPNVFSTGTGPSAVAMSPTAPFLFVANQTSGNISAFTVDPGAGGLGGVQGSPFPISPVSNPTSLAVTPQGNLLYVANPTQGTVAGFVIGSNGQLSQAGAPTPVGTSATPTSLVIDHSGRFLYVADSTNNAVAGFAIQSNGSLTPIAGSPFAAGLQPLAVAADPQGTVLFAANSGSNNVSAYVIDSATGALGPVKGAPFATGGLGPSGLAVDAHSTVLYVTDQGTHDVAAMVINTDGSLQAVTGSPFAVATAATVVTPVLR
ncbi:MAG TPA: beta-propeller fold lactonase family protein [Candidatus Angelobacter sp.]|nr:beta-propeller fold lactonase family protein [Candidatus Angelobacter sp.]